MKPKLSYHRSATVVSLAALLLLSACAPVAGQSGAPLNVDAGPVAVTAGQTVFVRVDTSLAAFGLKPNDVTPALWVPSSYDADKGNVGAYFGLNDVQVAAGWQAKLSEVTLERSSRSGSTTYSMWAVIRLSVPDDAIAGVYRVRGTLQARGGATQPVAFQVSVQH